MVRNRVDYVTYHGLYCGPGRNYDANFLLPSVLDREVRVEGFITAGPPETTIRCVQEDSYSVWVQLFLGFVHPWKRPIVLENELVEHLALECMADLVAELGEAQPDDPEPELYPPDGEIREGRRL